MCTPCPVVAQAAQEALLRCNARCEELVGQLAAAERRADELQRRCEDAELEVGVVQVGQGLLLVL